MIDIKNQLEDVPADKLKEIAAASAGTLAYIARDRIHDLEIEAAEEIEKLSRYVHYEISRKIRELKQIRNDEFMTKHTDEDGEFDLRGAMADILEILP